MKSMTGYGREELSFKKRKFSFEVKTVNHRFCEVNLKLPSRLYPLEPDLAEFSKKNFHRGRVDIFIRENANASRNRVKVDEDQLKYYLQMLQKLSKISKEKTPVHLESLLSLPQVIVLEEETENLKELSQILKSCLQKVFKKVEEMREKEGEILKKEFLKHLSKVERHLSEIEGEIPKYISAYQTRLQERIEKLVQKPLDEWRLAQEVAYYVDRTDIAEEVQRLKSHLQHFRDVLSEKEAIGRKLDFILQEMNREVNTLGSKAQGIVISEHVVSCKHELEKMREQVQNVE